MSVNLQILSAAELREVVKRANMVRSQLNEIVRLAKEAASDGHMLVRFCLDDTVADSERHLLFTWLRDAGYVVESPDPGVRWYQLRWDTVPQS